MDVAAIEERDGVALRLLSCLRQVPGARVMN